MKQIKRVTMVFLVVILLMGCGFNRANDNDNTDNGGNNATDNEVQNENTTDQEADNNDVNDNANNEDQGQIEVADEVAERVTELEEVNSATVILTDNNAYTAVVLNDQNGEDLTVDLEDKIAEQVRATDTSIENVYVSLNPDVVQRMSDYATKINEGNPVEGFFEEFTEAMNRMFPDPR